LRIASYVLEAVPKTNRTHRDGSNTFEIGMAVDILGQDLRLAKIASDGFAKGILPVILERHPDLECAETARQLDRLVKESESLGRIIV
jgi:chaperonin GroEL (HSP60 family)